MNKENLWKNFENVKNNQEGLKRKGKATGQVLGVLVTKKIATLTSFLKEQNSLKLELEKQIDIVLEFYAFFMHFIDRQSWHILGSTEFTEVFGKTANKGKLTKTKTDFEDKRNIFLDELCKETTDGLSKVFLDMFSEKIDIKKDILVLFNERNLEYARYREVFPKENEGSKDTLIWEFSKRITKIIEGKGEDIKVIMVIYTTTCDIIKTLQLPELLSSRHDTK